MKTKVDLLESNILTALTKLSIPIVLTSLIQMAYNMTDMLWVGRIGSGGVTAVGTAGMYMWFSNGLALIAKIGGQVKTGYCVGANRLEEAKQYISATLHIATFIGVLFGIICLVFTKPMIDFFNLSNGKTVQEAMVYLKITGVGMVCSFLNQAFAGIFTAIGKSTVLLLSTAVGLVTNMILDPVLIFGMGPFSRLEVMGAALATMLAQLVVTVIFFIIAWRDGSIFEGILLVKRQQWSRYKELLALGIPMALQSILFTTISMVIARVIATFGDHAVAVQKVGSQIESISWVIGDGFSASINAFLAQNNGAGKKSRIKKGYGTAIFLAAWWGAFCNLILFLFPKQLFGLFLPDKELLQMGVDYLRILSVSQIFMCIELTTAGAFSGMGKTIPPSLTSIVLTAIRIPFGLFLSFTILGLNGIWWSISISSVAKGTVLCVWFLLYLRKK